MALNQNQTKNRNQDQRPNWVNEFQKNWIAERIDTDGIAFAENFGKFLANNQLSTSQIRNIFGEVKRIQMSGIEKKENQTAFLLLKPKMAYAVKRQGKRGLEELSKVINKAFDAVDVNESDTKKLEKQYQNFVDFFEALLAYHKAYGGN